MNTTYVITSYRMWPLGGSHNEFGSRSKTMPRDWIIEGSNDNSSWTTIDTQTDQIFDEVCTDAESPTVFGSDLVMYAETEGLQYSNLYTIAYPGSYKYYRMIVQDTSNSLPTGYDNYTFITEMAYYGTIWSHITTLDSSYVSTGDYGSFFSGTPPSTITMTAGNWNGQWEYIKTSSSNNSVVYELNTIGGSIYGSTYGSIFEIDANHDLVLDVNDSTYGTERPDYFVRNGTTTYTSGRGVVNINDDIDLYRSSGVLLGSFTVPTELEVKSSKLALTTDAGEYLKIDLGTPIVANAIRLKSVTEYKEPVISMTDYNQYGYEVSFSSEFVSAIASEYAAWKIFDGKTLTTDVNGVNDWNIWISGSNTYSNGSGDEWIQIKLLDKRSLVSYKLTRHDGSENETPKVFSIYGSNDNSTWTLIPGSSNTLTESNPISMSGSTYDLENPSPLYQYFRLNITETYGGTIVRIAEWELFCQPSEIDEFKLYGSLDDSIWTEIHHETSVPTITSTGTEFSITNENAYQHYGLVVTKTRGHHNVSIGEMKIIENTDTTVSTLGGTIITDDEPCNLHL